MLMDIWASVGEFVCENYEVGLVIGLAITVVAIIAQYIINSSLEEDLIELTERVEEMEKMLGVTVDSENETEKKEE